MGRVLLATVIAGLLLSGCGEKKVEIPEPESRPVKLQAVSVGDNETFRTFPAIVEAGDKAVLAFRVSGQIISLDVNTGANVKRGQKLASLNPDELTLLVEQAQANYELAYVQFKRDEELRKTNVVSELDYDTSKAALNQAQAALSKQKSNLGYATLVAPYDGTLSLSLIENYEYIMAKEPVMHIQSAGLINVTFQLPEHLLARYQGKSETQASVIFDTIPGEVYPAEFKEIDTEADATTSSFKVTLFMERPEGKNILPGMAGLVKIAIPKGNSGAIAKRAIMREGNANYVWHIDEAGIARKTQVELDDKGRVVSGLNDGDQIAISGIGELQEGQKVRAWVKERGL
ncbi:efflux RND transporter periplasmic adaptor subunit [Photobacterium chitinilyticum]|uniref:Efflux RND transporter periplasmic adaptor subunit n=1 Tax=Photobacterium chitinilyticum TaxID=2485123 RepID=A0A444JQR3_9GAMM|nr:efflux RND transporter periplasmic adaptor subunit [Photobacterium chitinilyticum]RWX55406.1 efflux RND transporter periplasmic adaptor subunit [Photobacterium chitinilyticum]